MSVLRDPSRSPEPPFCRTPGARYRTRITGRRNREDGRPVNRSNLEIRVELPFYLGEGDDEGLEGRLHDALESALAPLWFWPDPAPASEGREER